MLMCNKSTRLVLQQARRQTTARIIVTQRWFSSDDRPVLIVGGGPSGLLMANLLNRYGVDFRLIEAQTPSQRFRHPQAHFINTRSMEILKHALPDVYQSVVEAMPPVKEWSTFYFGADMSSSPPMASVVHPVDAPLVAGVDANGKLKENCQHAPLSSSSVPLSDCSVGHLAQHTFCRILYEAVTDSGNVHYGTRVQERHCDQNGMWHLTTANDGRTYSSPHVIAADGANSEWRQQLGIEMNGQPIIQHLINVHFTVKDEGRIPPGMLYTIFSPSVLCMIVRHGAGDYVMQIPYFPPYQNMREDFSFSKVQGMVRAALGDASTDFEIESIQPWTMGSLVADEYSRNGVTLVGDAAHVFPPAGGFGMNTGLQDVFNLAWRLALGNNKGVAYQEERQLVARSNAALSVRNYQRVLGVMQACYLDHQHPVALIAGLEVASSFVPMELRRKTFATLLQTALWPLGQLKTNPNSVFSNHVTNNLRHLLQSGQGLPLLFPNHEVAFRYGGQDHAPSSTEDVDLSHDTMAQTPQLVKGGLFPHMTAIILSGHEKFPRLCRLTEDSITTRDLPSQLATDLDPCSFCLLRITSTKSKDGLDLKTITETLEQDLKLPFTSVELTIDDSEKPDNSTDLLNLSIDKLEWQALEMGDSPSFMVVIRPDGHVASIVTDADLQQLIQDTHSCL